MQIAITAGHSAKDPGAVNPRLKMTEAGLALSLRNQVAGVLRTRGFAVVEDGDDATNKPLVDALKLIPGRLAVEIHFNAGPATATGVECIALLKDKAFAQSLSRAVAKVLRSKLRGEGGWIDQKQSQHSRLAYVNAGGLILEVAFISNDQDMIFYTGNTSLVARAIADAIAGHLDAINQ